MRTADQAQWPASHGSGCRNAGGLRQARVHVIHNFLRWLDGRGPDRALGGTDRDLLSDRSEPYVPVDPTGKRAAGRTGLARRAGGRPGAGRRSSSSCASSLLRECRRSANEVASVGRWDAPPQAGETSQDRLNAAPGLSQYQHPASCDQQDTPHRWIPSGLNGRWLFQQRSRAKIDLIDRLASRRGPAIVGCVDPPCYFECETPTTSIRVL